MGWRLVEEKLLFSDEKRIALEKVQSFVEFITQHKKLPPQISLANVEYFDPVLIAWVALLAQKYIEYKNESQRSKLIKVIPPRTNEYFKSHQVAILVHNRYLELLTFRFHINVSKDFSPVFVINEASFKALFKQPFKVIWEKFRKEFEDEKIQEKFHGKRATKKAILESLKKIIRDFERKGKLDIQEASTLLYFMESLSPLALVRKIVDELFNSKEWENRPGSLGIPLDFELQSNYENEAMNFLKEYILSQPPFFIYLFSLCVRNFYNIYIKANKEKKSTDIIKTCIDDIYNLHAFCMDFYLGIRELAKNIVEHAGEKENKNKGEGAIVTRVYGEEKSEQFIEDVKKYSGTNVSWPANDELKGVFTVYVVDKGEKGIVRTSIEKLGGLEKIFENITSEKNNEIVDIIKQDRLSLEEDKTGLKDFYDYRYGFKMLHQKIRTAAGIGLMIFSKLLTLNKGLMWVSSPGKNPSRMDSVCMYHKTWCKDCSEEVYFEENDLPLFPTGTSYLFVLPVPRFKQSTLRSQRQPGEKSQSPASSSVFIEMASSQRKKLGIEKLEFMTLDRVLIKWPIKSNEKDLKTISQEWKEYDKKLNKLKENLFPIILLKPEFELDASDVFHILSMVELASGVRSIVLSNISLETIEYLIRILLIYDKHKANIWSKDCLSLIIPSDSSYPPFIVGGEKYEEWKYLNEKIARFYNNDSWVRKLEERKQ